MTKCSYLCCIVHFPFLSKVESSKYAVKIFSPIGSADVQVFSEFGAGLSLSCVWMTSFSSMQETSVHNCIIGLKAWTIFLCCGRNMFTWVLHKKCRATQLKLTLIPQIRVKCGKKSTYKLQEAPLKLSWSYGRYNLSCEVKLKLA